MMAPSQDARRRRKSDDVPTTPKRAKSLALSVVAAFGGGLILVACYWLGVSVGLFAALDPVDRDSARSSAAQDRAAIYASTVAHDTDEVWSGIFLSKLNRPYTPPDIAFFSGHTTTACGRTAAPQYCPEDTTLYLDTAFLAELRERANALGDLAAAYVVARTVAHHVQVKQADGSPRDRVLSNSETRQGASFSLRLALQRECYSGIWTRRARSRVGKVDAAEIERVMQGVRDLEDRLVQEAETPPELSPRTRRVLHVEWFMRGYQSASLGLCQGATAGSL